jgi:two-component system capsular synthesis response regulator RcsB
MRVVIADDHSVVRVGLRILINASRRCVIVGEADNADSLMNVLSSTPCDLLITDFSMPGGQQADGLKMLSTIQRLYPALPIILVTMFTSVATARAALAQGVMAIVAKAASATELSLAIKAVQEGHHYLVSPCARYWPTPAISCTNRHCLPGSTKWSECSPAA